MQRRRLFTSVGEEESPMAAPKMWPQTTQGTSLASVTKASLQRSGLSPGRNTWPSGQLWKACSPSASPNTRRSVARFRLNPASRLKNSSDYYAVYPVVQTPNWILVPCLHFLYSHITMASLFTMKEYKLIGIYTSTTYRGISCISRYQYMLTIRIAL